MAFCFDAFEYRKPPDPVPCNAYTDRLMDAIVLEPPRRCFPVERQRCTAPVTRDGRSVLR